MSEQPLRVLIVDDDEVDRLQIRRALAAGPLAAECTDAADVDEAMRLVTSAAFDCAVVDYRLPPGSGLDVVAAIRRAAPGVALVGLTGQGDETIAVQMMKAGAADYLSKHAITSERLQQSVRYAVAMTRAERERQQLLAEAQAANRAKDEFLAALSHELRTPLNAILGWSRLLTSGILDDAAAKRAAQTIERNALIQVKLIDDLLDVSRIIIGKLQMDRAPVSLPAVVEATVESHRPAAVARGLTLHYRVEGRERALNGDAPRLQQVVGNLLSNAIKFTPAGGRVDVALTMDGETATIRVSDTGLGMDAQFLPLAFERFTQADSGNTRAHGGLGLGLSIVRHIVEQHGGSVSAHSDGLGHGSSFVVTLPVAPDGASAGTPPPGADLVAADLANVHVLVVDDEPDARGLLETILTYRGATVTAVDSVESALAAFGARRPNVVLTDIAMPREDGYSLLRHVQRRDPTVPLVAVSAFANVADRSRALAAGFAAHFAKPIDAEQVCALVAGLTAACGVNGDDV